LVAIFIYDHNFAISCDDFITLVTTKLPQQFMAS